MSTPGKKLSGSQNRKRKLQQEKEALKSRVIMESYLGKESQTENPEDKKIQVVHLLLLNFYVLITQLNKYKTLKKVGQVHQK